MTPAINVLKKAGIAYQIHAYQHDEDAVSYGLEAAEALGVEQPQVFSKRRSLSIYSKSCVVAIVPSYLAAQSQKPGASGLEESARIASPKSGTETGYVWVGIKPRGRKCLLTVNCDSAPPLSRHNFVSAVRRGLDMECAPADHHRTTAAKVPILLHRLRKTKGLYYEKFATTAVSCLLASYVRCRLYPGDTKQFGPGGFRTGREPNGVLEIVCR